ncbi:MMS19 nucleotide excision repair protein [Thraustotheca clavata]|uniref:MMS19 nucleotide excision repair protein n=1 Tax=Thraustotheca clavata TaxID=74557 RepID=A0A1V9YUW0_9STRA|nr:MMS19 nucleotide excision repair protein [Thraustotheca clavata]
MFSLDAPLQPAIDGFVDPENGETQHTTHLNNVIMQVHRSTPIEQVIHLLGSHLTHTADKRRARATLLLAEILTRLPDLRISADTTHLLLVFFLERLKDAPSVAACLKALCAIIALHPTLVTAVDAANAVETLVNLPTPISSLSQALRKQSFELLQHVVRMNVLDTNHARVLMEGFLKAMQGEKDPRNLLFCLQFATELLTTYFALVDADVASAFFTTTSCYFPITFRPPPNDPYGIKSEDLIAALRSVFVAHDSMAKHVMPMVLDKLSRTTVADMTKDILDTLGYCCSKYPLNRLLLHFTPVTTAIYHHILHGDNTAIIQVALSTLKTITLAVSPPSKLPGMQALAWTKFVGHIVQQAHEDLLHQAPDSMVSNGAGSALCAIASVGVAGFSTVLNSSMQLLLDQCTAAPGSPAEAALARVVLLLDCIDSEVDHSTHPLAPYVAAIQSTLLSILRTSTTSRQQKLCLQGLRRLVLRPPSPLLSEHDLAALLQVWTSAILSSQFVDVREEATSTLQAIALKSAPLAQQVSNLCIPQLLQVIENPQANEPSQRSADLMVKDVLSVLTKLSQEPSIFKGLLLRLCQINWAHTFASTIMAAVAEIVVVNKDKVVCMDYCVFGEGDSKQSILIHLVAAVISHVENQTFSIAQLQPFVSSTTIMCGTIMQTGSIAGQSTLLQHLLGRFLTMNVSPLRPEATPLQLELTPVLASALYSCGGAQSDASVLPQLLQLLFGLSQRYDALVASDGAIKALSALFNILAEDSPLLVSYMKWLTATAPIAEFKEVPLCVIILDQSKPAEVRTLALKTYVFICKAMVLRGHAKFVPPMLTFMCSLLTTPFDLRPAVAQSFAWFVEDSTEVLTPACHAIISPVHRQRTFTHIFPLLYKEDLDYDGKAALMLVIAHTPQAVLIPSLPQIVPLVIMALTEGSLLGHSALATFKICLQQDPKLIQGFYKEVFHGLLWQCQHGQTSRDRMDALECIGGLATTKYELIHPYKDMVIKQLLIPLDDRKRVVRQLAVKIRNQWSIL